ncbi:MAG: hypothetical protein ACTSUB_03505 [Candidatus Thorarchaeota archaeon]
MGKRILVLGINSFDSGKTFIAENIARILSKDGIKTEYFKPVSGHNHWSKYYHSQKCISEGKLYSSDATAVRAHLESNIPIEIANPIHSLFVPAIRDHPNQHVNSSLGLGGWDAVLAMQRFSRPENGRPLSTTLVAESLIGAGKLMLSVEEALALSKDTQIQTIASLEDAQAFELAAFEGVVNDSFDVIDDRGDVVIIEGFNNTAWPWEGLDSVDVVIAVGPGHIFTYNPERYRKGSFIVKYGSQPIRDVPFTRVSEMIKPQKTLLLKPGQTMTLDDMAVLGITTSKDE